MLGETIGHFKIVSRLGRGGMGEVYAGEHESIQTRVAIKVLHAQISSDTEHVQRFFNEAKIVGKIKHAGIVKIFDVGFLNDRAYLVMELLEGEPLSARIDRGKLAANEAADLGRQIASVLDATHRAGVIHRDLKPDNIFLVPDHELASGERVKILDFGISKLTGTMTGASPKTVGTMGTPAYMAPEQWGDSATIDWRADAYSLGCVLFEMICGRPPFVCNTIYEACGKHMSAMPPSPREFAELPDELDALVLRLLAKEPAERAVSMSQVSRELEAIATGRDLASIRRGMPHPIPVRRAASQPAIDSGSALAPASTPPRSARGEGTQQHAPRPAQSTLTTLSSTAAELVVEKRGRRTAWIGGGIAAAAVIGIVVVALSMGGSREPAREPAAEPAGSSMPAAPQPTAPPPSSPPQAAAPPDAAPMQVAAPAGSDAAAGSNVLVVEKPPQHPITKPAKPTAKPKPPLNAGSAASAGSAATVAKPPPPPPPPGNGSDIGGRI